MILRSRLEAASKVIFELEKSMQWYVRLSIMVLMGILVFYPFPIRLKWPGLGILLFFEAGHEINYYVMRKWLDNATKYWHVPFNIFLIALFIRLLGKDLVGLQWLYLLSIVHLAMLYGFNTAIVTAILAMISYSGLLWFYFLGKGYTYTDMIFMTLLFFIAAESGYLADIVIKEREEHEKAQELIRKLENANQQLSLLYHIARMLGEMGELKSIFQKLLEDVSQAMGADIVTILLLDESHQELRVEAARGLPEEAIKDIRIKVGEGVTGKVVGQKKPLIFNQPLPEELLVSCERYRKIKSPTSIFLPMMVKGKVYGAFHVSFLKHREFTSEEIAFLWTIAEDLTLLIENNTLYQNMELLAISDPLTKLYNRGQFNKRLQEELLRAERYHFQLSLILLDIDHFKEYNDLYGHVLGDGLLRQIAELIQGNIRKVDFAARYGGEEFTIILPNTNKSGALTVAERIRQAVAGTEFVSGEANPVHKTVSLGVATYPGDATNAEELILRTDQAMYEAKRRGRNLVQPYHQGREEEGRGDQT